MEKIIRVRLKPDQAADKKKFLLAVSEHAHVKSSAITDVRITRESIDARHKSVFIDRDVNVYVGEKAPGRYKWTTYQDTKGAKQAIVVGSGPAGLFAALRLLEMGVKPIVLERGGDVGERKLAIAEMERTGVVNRENNFAFGEGGAGAFSDGKLYTRSEKRGDVSKILAQFCQHGADPTIMYDARPHIGSDKLPGVVKSMRATIISHGGEVHFHSEVTSLMLDEEKHQCVGVKTKDGTEYRGPVILAVGHSAKELYQYLEDQHITIERKALAIGVRVEHPQSLIDQIQYHSPEGRGKFLPPADYTFVSQVKDRGVYSFCMCPGGVIVPTSTEEGFLSVNGMSSSHRSSPLANSGMVVQVQPEDLPPAFGGNLGMLHFLEALEARCWNVGGGKLRAPAQRMMDFMEGKLSDSFPRCSYHPGLISADLHQVLPPFISKRLELAFALWGDKAKGFLTNDAIMVAPETRTSSPVRIPRDKETLMHVEWAGLFPAGEGAGYAGGIVSAAIDGVACADALLSYLA